MEDISKTQRLVDVALDRIESKLQPLLQVPLKEASEKLSPIENARLHISLGYTLNALYFMYLKTQGVDPKTHPVKKELARIQAYIKKVKDFSVVKAGPNIKLDKAATNRFVKQALSREDGSKKRKEGIDDAEDEAGSSSNSVNNSSSSSPKKKHKKNSKTKKGKGRGKAKKGGH